MTSTDVPLTLRLPLVARAWAVGFPLLVAAGGLSGAVPLRGDPNRATVLAFCAFAALLGWRLVRLAAIGMPDGRLVLRNYWRDRTVLRDDIDEVRIGRGTSSWNRTVLLRLHDGATVRLDVAETQLGRRRLEQQANDVRAWVTGTPQPHR